MKKTPGPEQIHFKFFHHMGPKMLKYLVDYYNIQLRTGTCPSNSNRADIYAIPKPNKDHTKYQNYRPISCSNTISRVIDKLLAHRIQSYIINKKFLPPTICGFISGRSTTDAISILDQAIKFNKEKKTPSVLIKTDISKAYDSVDISLLLHKLKNKFGFRKHVLHWLKSYLTGRVFRIKYKNYYTSYYKIKQGIPQGASLSPILFALYTADFHPKTQETTQQIMFADDNIIFNSPMIHQNKHQIHQNIQIHLNNYYVLDFKE